MKYQTTPPIPPRWQQNARRAKWIAAAAAVIFCPFAANAADYTANFEGAGETKTGYASGSVTLSGISWNMTEALIGTSATDWKNGVRSARMQGYGTSSMTMLADKTGGAAAITFSYCGYSSDSQQPWAVEYSTDAAATWTQVGADFTAPSGNVVQTYSETLNQTGNIRFRIICKGAGTSNHRLNIDDISITGYAGADTTPPAIASFTPANGAAGVSPVTTQLVMEFSEPVGAGTGNITVYRAATDFLIQTIGSNTSAVLFEGSVVRITLPSSLDPSTAYYVNIQAGAFKDAANNGFAGITGNSAWTFTTGAADLTAPSIATLFPADNSTNVFPAANLAVTYNENIIAGSGSVVIRKFPDNSVVETITVPGAQVQVSGATATINPAAVLQYGTSYYVEIAAGAFKDAVNNPTAAASGNSAWNFTTRAAPAVVISQYYEGAGSDRYIELKNLTGSPLPLAGYRLAAWSNSDPAGREGWKAGTTTTTRVTDLTGGTIPANGSFLVADNLATAPGYAANNTDLLTSSGTATAFNGDDSVVLYNGPGFTQDEVIDAVSFSGNDGADKSFHRLNDLTGFDFNAGSSILNFTGTWAARTLADVASAAQTDVWYLKASAPPVELTVIVSPSSFSEGAGAAAATATVSRTGPTTEALLVIVQISDTSEASHAGLTVEIPAGASSAQFNIDAVNDVWQDGDKPVTVSVSADGYTPDSQDFTVLDEPADPVFPVVINEVDCDQAVVETVNDGSEFIELYNNSSQPVSLDGLVLVFYNGGTTASPAEVSYRTIDLSGNSIPANGFFVVGNAAVPNVSITFPADTLQNGADAVALHVGDAASYPNGTLAGAAPGYLVDAVVYDTNDADSAALLAALTPGKPQVDEGAAPASETVSIARVPNGGARFETTLYVTQAPTPGAANVVAPPGNTFANWIGGFSVGGQTGFAGDFDNDRLGNALENILGSSPAVSNPGLTAVSTNGGNLVFRHTLAATPATDLTAAYEWSVNLATWNASGATAGGLTVTFGSPVVITPGTPNLVEVTATASGGQPARLFARLKASQN